MDNSALIREAIKARKNSYSPYSKFAVGAALLCKDGKIFYGANIENASYPLCMCAERNAIYGAYNNGYSKDDLEALVIIADSDKPVSPCGACRQVINELFPQDGKIIMANLDGEYIETTIKELLPYAFDEEAL
jgi:cytidine deaminase